MGRPPLPLLLLVSLLLLTRTAAAATTARPTATTTAEPPDVTTAKPPANVTTAKPSVVTTVKPLVIVTAKPMVVTTAKPSVATTVKPLVITTAKSSAITTAKPSVVTTVKPLVIATTKSSAVTTAKPSVVTTVKPLVITTTKSSAVTTAKPSVVTTVKPLVIATAKPMVVTTVKPLVVTTVKPLELTTTEPLDTATKPLVATTVRPLAITTNKPLAAPTARPLVVATVGPIAATVQPPAATAAQPLVAATAGSVAVPVQQGAATAPPTAAAGDAEQSAAGSATPPPARVPRSLSPGRRTATAAAIRLPQDVEVVPGFTAPPGFELVAPSGGGGGDGSGTGGPAAEPPPLPTGAAAGGVPPPALLPDGNTTAGDHVNYEGLYYTVFADKNAHQEIRTPLEDLATESHSCNEVRSVPPYVRRQLGLSTFYQRYTEAYGIPVLSSARVPDAALRRACYILRFLFADIRSVRDSYRRRRGRVAVIGRNERTTQIPEHSSLGPAWDSRARGLGATDAAPVCTIGEENLLHYGYPTDRWYSEDIGLHEFAHGLHLLGARYAWPDWERRLRDAFAAARARGLWSKTYAATNYIEYFAEGVQKYHNVEAYSRFPNGIHNHVNTRDKLAAYDPALYKLVREMFPCGNQYIGRRQSGFKAASDSARLKLHYPDCRLESAAFGDDDGTDEDDKARPTPRPQPKTTRPSDGRGPDKGQTTPLPPRRPCQDQNMHCVGWARSGYCYSSAVYMTTNCRRSCDVCGACRDRHARCAEWASRGECAANPGYMLYNCRPSCRVC